MKKPVPCLASIFCFLMLTAPLHAATISTVSGLVTIGSASNVAGNIDFNALPTSDPLSTFTTKSVSIPTTAYSATGKLITSFAGITDGSLALAQAPVGTVGSHFLAVYSASGYSGSATFKFDQAPTLVSFNVGTLDDDNSLTVVDTTGARYTLTGTQMLAAAVSDGTIATTASGQSTLFLSLNSFKGIAQIILSTSNLSVMEISNMTAVPLPGALILFGTALSGVAYLRRRKMSKA